MAYQVQGPVYQHELTLIPRWKIDYNHHKVSTVHAFKFGNWWVNSSHAHFTGHVITYFHCGNTYICKESLYCNTAKLWIMQKFGRTFGAWNWHIHQYGKSFIFFRAWIKRWPVNSPHKGPVARKMFPFDDVIMSTSHNVKISDTIMILLCP